LQEIHIKLYELSNEHYNIKISSFGAELKSVLYKDHEYLHLGDSTYWHRSSPVLFPIVGKLKNNYFTYKNKSYSLPIHGLARHSEFELIEKTSNKLTFLLKEDTNSLKHYPFRFNLEIQYTLNYNNFKIEYKVHSDENIYFNLGAHPAFTLHSNIDDSYMEFEKDEHKDILCLDMNHGCISHTKKDVLTSNKLQLHHDIFSKDALIFQNLNSTQVSLKNTTNNKSVHVEFDGFTYLAFWAPVGAPFVCIEPWCGRADDIDTNHRLEDKTSIIMLEKDKSFIKTLTIFMT